MNNKIVMISIQSGTAWIRPDQIEHIEPANPLGHPHQELEVYLLNGEQYTVDDPEDVEKIMPFLLVLTTAEAAKEFCGPDSSIPF